MSGLSDRRDTNKLHKKLSKRLHTILAVSGASECIRKKWLDFAMLNEILSTFVNQINNQTSRKYSVYHVGSTYEGTTTFGLNSDCDWLLCDEKVIVVDNLVESKQQGKSFLIVTDDDTKPGYVCLQTIEDQLPLSVGICNVPNENWQMIDRKGRICYSHSKLSYGQQNTYRNGPAFTSPAKIGVYQCDSVYALRCRHIPRLFNSWLHRKQKYGWPSQKQLKTMGSYGCFIVGVGHPHSDNPSIEWRISFSLQERDLMSNLNETQHTCYILLKMIKKDIIESNAGESISSYHCKTSMFYTIENTPKHIWKCGNLIHCTRLCLIRLLSWVKAKQCPNYFVPEANLFDKLSPTTMKMVEHVLNDILKSGVNFLYTLTCDGLGEKLKSNMSYSELVYSLDDKRTMIPPPVMKLCCLITRLLLSTSKTISTLSNVSYKTNMYTGYKNWTMQLLHYLHNVNHVKENTTRHVRMAFDALIPYIQLQYDQCLFSEYLSRADLVPVWSKTFPTKISETSSDFDLISSKLSLASLYVQCEQFQEECNRILVSCEKSLKSYVISICACNSRGFCSNDSALPEKLRFTEITSKYFGRRYTTCCMIFHPSQVSLVHAALQYEMFRNVYTTPCSEFEMRYEFLLNGITVDSQIYLFFLQYLLYSKDKKDEERKAAVNKLIKVLCTDPNLGHRQTALNLKGWIWLQENELQLAWISFYSSWQFKPFNNAAKWHMLILLSRVLKGN